MKVVPRVFNNRFNDDLAWPSGLSRRHYCNLVRVFAIPEMLKIFLPYANHVIIDEDGLPSATRTQDRSPCDLHTSTMTSCPPTSSGYVPLQHSLPPRAIPKHCPLVSSPLLRLKLARSNATDHPLVAYSPAGCTRWLRVQVVSPPFDILYCMSAICTQVSWVVWFECHRLESLELHTARHILPEQPL